MSSRVHPKYKTKYRVNNWAEYDRALVQRGDLTLWISKDATDGWKPTTSGKRGGQRKFSDPAIETVLMLRLVFNLPLRQTEGFLSQVWPGWKEILVIVQPETVIRWYRKGFRLYWRSISKRGPGRPPIPDEVQALIR